MSDGYKEIVSPVKEEPAVEAPVEVTPAKKRGRPAKK